MWICYDRIDISEEIDVNKASKSEECDICRDWYFLIKGLNFNQMSAIDSMIYEWYLLTLVILLL